MARSLTPTLDRKKRPPRIPPRAQQLVELMAVGAPDGSAPPMNLKEAAAFMGIAVSTASNYAGHPLAKQHYNRVLQEVRSGERGKNLQRAIQLRDQSENLTAAVQALRWLEPQEQAGPNVNVGVTITPGYVLAPPDIPRPDGYEGRQEPKIIEHRPADRT